MFSIDPHHFLNDARVMDPQSSGPAPMFVCRWVYTPIRGFIGDGKHPPPVN
jgi:hypothetical protein